MAVAFMGVVAGSIAFYAYVVPFLVSTVGGSILAGILVFTLQKSGALKSMRAALQPSIPTEKGLLPCLISPVWTSSAASGP